MTQSNLQHIKVAYHISEADTWLRGAFLEVEPAFKYAGYLPRIHGASGLCRMGFGASQLVVGLVMSIFAQTYGSHYQQKETKEKGIEILKHFGKEGALNIGRGFLEMLPDVHYALLLCDYVRNDGEISLEENLEANLAKICTQVEKMFNYMGYLPGVHAISGGIRMVAATIQIIAGIVLGIGVRLYEAVVTREKNPRFDPLDLIIHGALNFGRGFIEVHAFVHYFLMVSDYFVKKQNLQIEYDNRNIVRRWIWTENSKVS